jgi:hypothetical protein
MNILLFFHFFSFLKNLILIVYIYKVISHFQDNHINLNICKKFIQMWSDITFVDCINWLDKMQQRFNEK